MAVFTAFIWVISRFYNRNLRNLIFQFKRDWATREQQQWADSSREGGSRSARAGSGSERRGRFMYPLYDDQSQPAQDAGHLQ
jgi:hypothetical protein